MKSKNSTRKQNFYLSVFNLLERTTNLTNIQKELGLSKQQLNYYLRRLRQNGIIVNPSSGRWEILKGSKNSTKYGELLKKDTIRGHAYIVNINLTQNNAKYAQRLTTIKEKGINYKLVGAKETTPRIKVLGRKVWLCNNHIRIFDKPEESYYGETAIESRKIAYYQFKKIINCLENKLGIKLELKDMTWQKEHLAFIKNDLAIEENKKGNIMRISDEEGEWLLIDDSLGKGGELENIGKKSLTTNIPMQKWWNEHKEMKFEMTPKATLKMIQMNASNLQYYAENMRSHVEAIQTLSATVKELRDEVRNMKKS